MATDIESGSPRSDRFVRRRPWTVALMVAFAYGALLVGVAAAEYVSKMQKIDRGAYTDTFPPFLGTALLSWPSSSVVAAHLPAYPPAFDRTVYREVARERARGLLAPAAVQLLIVFLVTGLCSTDGKPWCGPQATDGRRVRRFQGSPSPHAGVRSKPDG